MPPSLASAERFTVTLSTPSLLICSLPVNVPSTADWKVTVTSTPSAVMSPTAIVVGLTVNTPFGSARVIVTSFERARPPTVNVLATGFVRSVLNDSVLSLVISVGTGAMAVPLRVTTTLSAPGEEMVTVAV